VGRRLAGPPRVSPHSALGPDLIAIPDRDHAA